MIPFSLGIMVENFFFFFFGHEAVLLLPPTPHPIFYVLPVVI